MVRIVLNHALRKMPRLRGGLGTVKWIQNIGPCRLQSCPAVSGGSYTLFRGDISHRTDRDLLHPSGRNCEEFYSMRLDKQASRIFFQINAGDGKQKFFQQGSLADV